jgi:small subunit ribosomal protein S6
VKRYDLVYIVRPDLEPDALRAVVDRIAQRIQEHGGQVEVTDVWGKRRMAYPIRRYREGVYVHTRFALDPQKVAEIKRAAALTEDVLRAMVTAAVGKGAAAAAGAPAAQPAEA